METYHQLVQNNNRNILDLKNKRYDYSSFIEPYFEPKSQKRQTPSIVGFLFVLAVLGLIWLSDSSSDVNADANLSPYPVYNGKIIIHPDYECICPLRIEAQSGMDCYVRLHYLGHPYSDVLRSVRYSYSGNYEADIAFYVEGSRTVEIDVPVGIYQFYYATGKTFYGVKDLFGKKTSCFTSNEKLYFYVDGYTHAGHKITLRKVPHGNFRTYSVNRSSFPTD